MKFISVTKEEFMRWLRAYPRSLDHDCFMDTHTWNDFSLAPKWPESIVAAADVNYESPDLEGWRIREDLYAIQQA